ncbi:SDR family NAD(P)-dependent oxidoreductase [Gordonia sp. (in: high G+C Gram-positive bacteria)]|uniref:SDR family NAD(P)-dependent oxidoreductase n=1 Tax=Gordonia sp. (in: high G+C Gram-positive bacteria) TaxID=84139 RepID=UPI0039E70D7A
MAADLTGKVALVTGAAGAIGIELCRSLRAAGARVAMTDLSAEGLERRSDELDGGDDLATFVADLTDDGANAQLPGRVVERFGSLDILINNAGARGVKPLLDIEPSEWRSTVDIDLTAPFVLSRAAIPIMAEQGRGKIVNIASMAGLAAFRDRAAYSAAKAGVIMLTKVIAVEYGERGIWCNAVAPGVVETPMTAGFFADEDSTSSIRANTPMRRWCQPDEIADPVLYLAGPDSDFVNGVVIPIDGGWTAGYVGAELSPRPKEK